MNKPKLSLHLTGLRSRLNALAEGRFRRVLSRLEQVPPLAESLVKLRPLKWAAFLGAGLLTADVAMQGVATHFDASKPPVLGRPRVIVETPYLRNGNVYDAIIAKNAFCPGCPVPDMKMRALERPKDCNKAQPVQGGIKLVGTIVLSDPRFSVATLTDGASSSNGAAAVQVGDTFTTHGKIFEIRRNRVCFLMDDGSLTYVENAEDQIQLGQPLPAVFPKSASEGIARTSDTQVSVKRSYLLEKLNDPQLLFQAYAAPATCEDGTRGFKMMSINPGSVYESLGIRVGDCFAGIDGQPMDFARAQETFQSIRTKDSVNIDVVRNGQRQTLSFQITK